MSVSQASRDNHYVPQFYLKRWSTNGNTVYDYRTVVSHQNVDVWRRASIKGTSYWRDLYTLYNCSDRQIDEIERFFSSSIETPAQEAFSKLGNTSSISANDIAKLVNFLIAQMFRTPHAMRRFQTITRNHFTEAILESLSILEYKIFNGFNLSDVQEKSSSEAEENIFPEWPLKIEYADTGICVSTSIGREGFLAAFDQLYKGRVGQMLRSFCWHIITLPIGREFPTSDNPVVLYRVRTDGRLSFDEGIGRNGTNILMPLDCKHALYTKVGICEDQIDTLIPTSYQARLLIYAVVKNADYHVYSKSRINNIERIRPRVIDPDLLNRRKKERDEWDKSQKETELFFSE